MISIHIKNEKDKINYIKISGHSGYDEIGKDIVCASISSICITTVNAIVRYDEGALIYTDSEGLLEMGIVKHDDIIDMLVENMICLLSDLERQYPKNVKIIK
jgi:hypothetical protein